MKNVLRSLTKSVLIPLGLTAVASAADAGIHKKTLGSGIKKLMISNEEMKNIIKIVRSFEDLGWLIKGITKTIEHKTKEQRGAFLSMLLGTLGVCLLGNMLVGKEEIQAGNGVIRAGHDFSKYKSIIKVKLSSKVFIHEINDQTIWRIGLT